MEESTFKYFAYGSNLLAKRIHINNPSAVRRGIGKLLNHRLDFATYSDRWHGASATIVPEPGACVWGAIWEINNIHMDSLDKQEGVDDHIYFSKMVQVLTQSGASVTCRTFQQTVTPAPYDSDIGPSRDRQPSKVYQDVILLGAHESELPEEYIAQLKKVKNNGYDGPVDINLDLTLKSGY